MKPSIEVRAAADPDEARDRFVYMDDDGSTRELTPDESEYLATAFHPVDGNRPYIKASAASRTPDGRLRGFLLRWDMRSTRVHRHIKAPRSTVYRLLVDAQAIAKWKVPDGMTVRVHEFDARAGGAIRVSLTYDEPTRSGKTAVQTDTYHGRFLRIVPNEQVVEVDEFETPDPALRGEMTSTITLSDAEGGTNVVGLHEGLPPGLSPADNETGWRMTLAKLAKLAEAEASGR
jgi:uncharacterized protein YndB with AHSA1/START domain